MLSYWLVDVMIRHWGTQQCQWSNEKMIGWPSIKRHDNTEVRFDRFWCVDKTLRDVTMPKIGWWIIDYECLIHYGMLWVDLKWF